MYLKLYCFITNVTTIGKRQQITTSNIRVPSINIQAKKSNTGHIYVGDNQVSSSHYGVDLESGDSVIMTSLVEGTVLSVKDIWIDTSVDGEGIAVSYLEGVSE
jgi:hypothetical protein